MRQGIELAVFVVELLLVERPNLWLRHPPICIKRPEDLLHKCREAHRFVDEEPRLLELSMKVDQWMIVLFTVWIEVETHRRLHREVADAFGMFR